jgi:hypothetical protein
MPALLMMLVLRSVQKSRRQGRLWSDCRHLGVSDSLCRSGLSGAIGWLSALAWQSVGLRMLSSKRQR